ncbi:histone H4-like [Cotesia typhae]|uniref:histone H4-like n=1 Tax=Cotesia typhae TaxID=2053667 RepID=UPI003D687FB8
MIKIKYKSMNEPRNNKSKRESGRKGLKNISRGNFYDTMNKKLKPSLYQLARGRGFTAIRQEINSALRNFIVNVLHNAMINIASEQRNSVTVEDIALALTRQEHTSHGFDN